MEYEIVNHTLKEILKAHGLECSEDKGWLIPNNQFPLISMTWYPKPDQRSGVLQVDVQLDKNHCIQECFGGIGAGEKGKNDGIHNFCVNSLHVMLSALWGIHDEEQVDCEEWTIDGDKYSVYIGPFGTRGSQGKHPSIPDNTFNTIKSAIQRCEPSEQCLWFRHYFCNLNLESKVYESLYNNEDWLIGDAALKSIDWHQSESFYSIRNFTIAIKHS